MLQAESSLQQQLPWLGRGPLVCCDLICQLWLLLSELLESHSESYSLHVQYAYLEGIPQYFYDIFTLKPLNHFVSLEIY